MIKNKQTFSITDTAQILIPDKLGRASYLFALGLAIIMIAVIGAVYARLPQNIPLYFSLPWGEARLAPKIMFMSLPGISLLLSMINLFLGRMATKLSPILPRVLAVASVVVAAMLLFATFGIIQSLVL
jgi:hypothetical protein